MIILTYIKQAWTYIFAKENRTKLYFLLALLTYVFVTYQCSRISDLKSELAKQKTENTRLTINYNASQDTIHSYITKNGSLKAEIKSYILTEKEFDTKYSSLFDNYEKEKNKKPVVVVKEIIKIVEKIVKVPVDVKLDSNGNGSFNIDIISNFPDSNSRTLKGTIPFLVKYFNKTDSIEIYRDSINVFAKPYPSDGTFEITQKIKLYTGLSYNKKEKVPYIWVQTKYPGVTIADLVGAQIIDDKESKKVLRQARKNWGLGLQLGYGISSNLVPTPYIGIGVNYTPKFLQW